MPNPTSGSMHWAFRAFLVLLGAFLLLVSLSTYSKPPYWESHESVQGQAEKKTLSQQNPTPFCIVLLIVGGALIVVAARPAGTRQISDR